ncbi:MAG: PorT family protein [Proteobacteria bacterium]|nr:PorT family protein [Pseudomonadota bacterium]
MKKLLSLSLFLMVSVAVAGDLLIIRGGREIRGRFLEESPTHLTFYTDYGKKIQVHKSRISVLLRNGEVLAVNPVVGNTLGIKTDNEVGKNQTASTTPPKLEEKNRTFEPVTQNGKGASEISTRETASAVTSENIPSEEVGLKVGATLGMTSSNASAGVSTQSRTGAEGGVVAELPFLGRTSLQPELLLSQSGYKSDGTVYRYSFVRIPVLIKYRYSIDDSFSLVGMAGPSLGFRSEAKSELAGVSTDLKATTKSTILGADLGLGGEYSFSAALRAFLNVRYSMQVNNLDTTVGATTAVRLRQWSFLTGFLFTL